MTLRASTIGSFSLVLALFALLSPAASAGTTLVLADGTERPQPWQTWADRARVPTPPLRVLLRFDPCPAAGVSCAYQDPPTIHLSAHGRRARRVLLHELGHVFDYTRLTDSDRGTFLAIMRDERPWRAPPNSPHEQFAVAYSACAMWPWFERRKWRRRWYLVRYRIEGYAYEPTFFQHRKVCALIRTTDDRRRN